LNSRYYNPEIGRFISSDGHIGELGNILSTNMYAYCANNPVMYTDSDGNFAVSIFLICIVVGAVWGGITRGVAAYSDGARDWDLVGQIAIGTVAGAAIGTAVGFVAGMGGLFSVGGFASLGGKFVEDFFAFSTFGTPFGTWEDYAVAYTFGGLSWGLFGKLPSFGGASFDVLVRPFANQLARIGTGRQTGFDSEKYTYDIATRAPTYFIPGPWKSFARGITRGVWDVYRRGLL